MPNPGDVVECQTCHGQYMPVQLDGTLYFHACPPLSPAEIQAGLDKGTVLLSARDEKRLDDAAAADLATPVQKDAPTRVEAVLASLVVARLNARDENVKSTREKDKGAIKAPGLGEPLPIDAATGEVETDA